MNNKLSALKEFKSSYDFLFQPLSPTNPQPKGDWVGPEAGWWYDLIIDRWPTSCKITWSDKSCLYVVATCHVEKIRCSTYSLYVPAKYRERTEKHLRNLGLVE